MVLCRRHLIEPAIQATKYELSAPRPQILESTEPRASCHLKRLSSSQKTVELITDSTAECATLSSSCMFHKTLHGRTALSWWGGLTHTSLHFARSLATHQHRGGTRYVASLRILVVYRVPRDLMYLNSNPRGAIPAQTFSVSQACL